MIYLDDDYKIDCENKIKYDHLVEISKTNSRVVNNIFNADRVFTDNDPQNPIYLVIGTSSFYVKNVKFCKEIAPNLYKVSINPWSASKTVANRQRRTLEGN